MCVLIVLVTSFYGIPFLIKNMFGSHIDATKVTDPYHSEWTASHPNLPLKPLKYLL